MTLLLSNCRHLCVCVCSVTQSCPTLCDPMDCGHQAPLSMEFSKQEYWSGLPFPSPGDLPNPETKPKPPALQADSLSPEPSGLYLLSDECPPFSLNVRSTMFQTCVNNSYQDLNTYPRTESLKSLQHVLRHTKRSVQLSYCGI